MTPAACRGSESVGLVILEDSGSLLQCGCEGRCPALHPLVLAFGTELYLSVNNCKDSLCLVYLACGEAIGSSIQSLFLYHRLTIGWRRGDLIEIR